jgi:hypothetical protein
VHEPSPGTLPLIVGIGNVGFGGDVTVGAAVVEELVCLGDDGIGGIVGIGDIAGIGGNVGIGGIVISSGNVMGAGAAIAATKMRGRTARVNFIV